MERNDELMHYGVKGMKWGVRKAEKQARKDAKEYARAKMFYGEGAGTRRKLINNTVNERSKDPAYKKAFDEALSSQDMAKHASKAKSERKRKDAGNSVKKTGRGVVNIVTGHPERLGAAMAAGYGVYALSRKYGVDKVILKHAKKTISSVRNTVYAERGRREVDEMLKNMWRNAR